MRRSAIPVLVCSVALAPLSGSCDEQHADLPEITITADPLRPGLLNYGGAASVLRRDDVLRRGSPAIGESLAEEPGVSSTYFGPNASRPVIRGSSGERIRVLSDGVGTLDVSNVSEDHAVPVDPYAIEQVEILRGPETLLYGSSAIGGVVNTASRSIPEQPIGSPVTGEISIESGTADDSLSGGATVAGEAGRLNWQVSGFHRDTEDVEIPGQAESDALRAAEAADGESHEDGANGTLRNSFAVTRGATGGGSYVWERGFLGASVSTYRSFYGVPGHMHGGHGDHEEEHDGEHEGEGAEGDHLDEEHSHDDHDTDDHHADGAADRFNSLTAPVVAHAVEHGAEDAGVAIDLEQVRTDLAGEVRPEEGVIERVRFRGAASNYDHKELEGGEVATTFQNDAGEARVELVHKPVAGFRGALGFQLRASDFRSDGEEAYLPASDLVEPALFMFEEYKLDDRWTLQLGGRTEYSSLDADQAGDEEFFPFGVSAGAVFDPTAAGDYTVGLSVSYTQRAPSASELFANGAHVARQIFELGDRSLGEEGSWGVDLTFKKSSGLVTTSFNLFLQQYDDFINLAATGEEEDELPVFAYDATRARLWGFELESTLHLHDLLSWQHHLLDLEGRVDLTRGEDLSEDTDLPRMPPLKAVAKLRYGLGGSFAADVTGVFVQEQDQLAPFELPTRSYELLNASVEKTIASTEDVDVALFVRGWNLTDREARVHTSFLKDLAPLPGRSLLFGVRARF